MKRLFLSLLLVPFLLPGTAAGQNPSESKTESAKLWTISGKVSEDGKNLIAANGQPWSVTNPETLVGRVGQQVKVKCRISSSGQDIRVLSVKTVPTQTKYTANPSDSAFRR